jgi:hypothetical protein
MTVTVNDFKNRFPEFASVDSATITRWIDEGLRQHNVECWGAKSDDGLAYMVAHFLAAFPPGGCSDAHGFGPGVLTGSSEGQVSASWSPMTIPKDYTKDDFGTTKYGRRYLTLRKSLFCCRCT